ncbi:hypothetical protein H663_018620 [Limnohabitans planktonicus II-D5]|uniref:Uncharacterized protein n=1 Tax=Limnohabitans planktonicus II-D5 TaxID=1293045 RepID=A0A2T7U952_9BURK|nr:hypothetical protein H663_018620 [Limnohabitans planktonicus II-D5]
MVPPKVVMSAVVNSALASDRVKVMVAVWPVAMVDAVMLSAMVGAALLMLMLMGIMRRGWTDRWGWFQPRSGC